MKFGTIFSPCERYRYTLERDWSDTFERNPGLGDVGIVKPELYSERVMFLMLNPSTADAVKLDPTVTRCRNYAIRWGYGGFFVCNLFAFRATDPRDMKAQADPVGPLNDVWIRRVADASHMIVCAWGMDGAFQNRDDKVIQYLPREKTHCLQACKDGVTPRHPLYLAKNIIPVKWPA